MLTMWIKNSEYKIVAIIVFVCDCGVLMDLNYPKFSNRLFINFGNWQSAQSNLSYFVSRSWTIDFCFKVILLLKLINWLLRQVLLTSADDSQSKLINWVHATADQGARIYPTQTAITHLYLRHGRANYTKPIIGNEFKWKASSFGHFRHPQRFQFREYFNS